MAENTVQERETLVLGGGCFWCLEAVYERVQGVLSVESGYAGGEIPDPTYEQVCSGTTGHAEVVKIVFDPTVISFPEIIDIFWKAHDPTTLNRQGADWGTQYRSIILYKNQEQKRLAEDSLKQAQPSFRNPIVTEIKALDTFYPAEDYHQDYYENYPYGGYCREPLLHQSCKSLKESLKMCLNRLHEYPH